MDVIETDLLVEVQVKNVKPDGKQHLYLLE